MYLCFYHTYGTTRGDTAQHTAAVCVQHLKYTVPGFTCQHLQAFGNENGLYNYLSEKENYSRFFKSSYPTNYSRGEITLGELIRNQELGKVPLLLIRDFLRKFLFESLITWLHYPHLIANNSKV